MPIVCECEARWTHADDGLRVLGVRRMWRVRVRRRVLGVRPGHRPGHQPAHEVRRQRVLRTARSAVLQLVRALRTYRKTYHSIHLPLSMSDLLGFGHLNYRFSIGYFRLVCALCVEHLSEELFNLVRLRNGICYRRRCSRKNTI